jgi:predicted ribosome quality control (RQC) complex YloA/Tae2 family protein
MGKTRMSVLDLRVQAREIRSRLVGSRVANIYDVGSGGNAGRTYVLKLSVPPPRTNHGSVYKASCEPDEQLRTADDDADRTAPALGRPADDGWRKILLLVESGARVHTTQYERDHGAVPTGFCLKLRKHLRTRRLDDVRQLGSDRVLALTFSGGGATVAHVFCEFHSGGNIVLTEPDYTVLALLRTIRARETPTVAEDDPAASAGAAEEVKVRQNAVEPSSRMDFAPEPPQMTRILGVRDRYPIEEARPAADVTLEAVQAGVFLALARAPTAEAIEAAAASRGARRKMKTTLEARKSLAVAMELGPQIVEHALATAGLALDASIALLRDAPDLVSRVHAGLVEIENMIADEDGSPARGLVFVQPPKEEASTDAVPVFNDFSPFMLAQYTDRQVEEFETFDEAVDTYFTRLEMDRAEIAKAKRGAAAYKKVDKLTAELHGQVTALESAQKLSQQKAKAIESNIVEVDAALKVVSSAIAAAVDWEDLGRMVENEKKNGNNPVAEVIHSLHLDRNEITLMLEDTLGLEDDKDQIDNGENEEESDNEDNDNDDDDDDYETEEGQAPAMGKKESKACKRARKRAGGGRVQKSGSTRRALLVDVDLSLSAHANAREYYAMKKTAAFKMDRAVEATDRTIKVASKRAAVDAQKMEADAVASSIRARRKAYWFEKFNYFISSENYLVVAGRDAQQNEMLVKRFLGPYDAYVHADMHGASSVIVKNQKKSGNSSYADIPTITLEQAGTFAMCRSSAWDAKIVTSAWWVRASQVSKTAPTGLSLATGSFVIRGKKNFLNPTNLVMGYSFLFKVHESCIVNHLGERSIRSIDNVDDGTPVALTAAEADAANLANADNTASDADSDDEEDSILIVGRDNENSAPTGGKSESMREQESSPLSSSDSQHDSASAPAANLAKVTIGSGDDSKRNVVDAQGYDAELSKAQSDDDDDDATAASMQDDAKLFASFAAQVDTKYGLCTEGNNSVPCADADIEPEAPAPTPSTKRRMSAKERRLMRSSGKLAAMEGNAVIKPVSPAEIPVSARKDGAAQTSAPRGRKAKLKKMKKKYGDQDEVERDMALAVLGAKKVKEVECAEKLAAGEQFVPDETEEERQAFAAAEAVASEPKRPPRTSRQERNEVMRLLDEEGIQELTALEMESVGVLDMLTASPLPDDVVEFALPICAPLSALTNYRYKVKLLPGTTKRGKAYRACLGLCLRQAEKDLRAHAQERDALRLVPEADALHMMLGNARIMAAGLNEAQRGKRRK